MKILIVSYYFPPYNTIGAIRAGKMAKYFHQAGHDVRVISAEDPILEGPLPKTLAVEIPKDKIDYTKWFDLNKWSRSLYLKIFNKKNLPPTFHHKQFKKRRSPAQVLTQTLRSIVNIPDAKFGWVKYAVKKSNEVFKSWKPDIVYATALPLTSLIVGQQISKKNKLPFVAEFRDLWVFSHDYPFQIWRKKIDELVEKKVLSYASKIVTVSEPLAEILRNAYGKYVRVIYNGYDPDDFKPFSESHNLSRKLQLVYTGTLYFPFQDPKLLFEALMELPKNEIEVHFYTNETCKTYLEEEVKTFGLESVVILHDKVSHKEAIQKQCEADMLIHFLWDDPNQKGIFSAKLLEYIGARRPVFVMGVKNDISDFVESSGLGMHFSESKNLVHALSSAKEKKKKKESFVTEVKPEIRNQFSRKVQAQEMIKIFEEVLVDRK